MINTDTIVIAAISGASFYIGVMYLYGKIICKFDELNLKVHKEFKGISDDLCEIAQCFDQVENCHDKLLKMAQKSIQDTDQIRITTPDEHTFRAIIEKENQQ